MSNASNLKVCFLEDQYDQVWSFFSRWLKGCEEEEWFKRVEWYWCSEWEDPHPFWRLLGCGGKFELSSPFDKDFDPTQIGSIAGAELLSTIEVWLIDNHRKNPRWQNWGIAFYYRNLLRPQDFFPQAILLTAQPYKDAYRHSEIFPDSEKNDILEFPWLEKLSKPQAEDTPYHPLIRALRKAVRHFTVRTPDEELFTELT